MGRLMKRVPVDSQAPIGKTWKGYLNPHRGPCECSHCEGSGYNKETTQIADNFYYYSFELRSRPWHDNITQDEVQALVDEDRLWRFTHVRKQDGELERREDGYIPTAKEINLSQHGDGFGHDCINRHILIKARAKRLGVYGLCPACKGKGSKFPTHVPRRPYKAWRESEPPTGGGYQLWENTSEGSPISPVFASAQDLARWCTDNATVFADEKTSYENWLSMFMEDSLDVGSFYVIQPGFAGALVNAPA